MVRNAGRCFMSNTNWEQNCSESNFSPCCNQTQAFYNTVEYWRHWRHWRERRNSRACSKCRKSQTLVNYVRLQFFNIMTINLRKLITLTILTTLTTLTCASLAHSITHLLNVAEFGCRRLPVHQPGMRLQVSARESLEIGKDRQSCCRLLFTQCCAIAQPWVAACW